MEKELIIYTATDKASTKLKAATQIILTLTPEKLPGSVSSVTPVVWQVIDFLPNCNRTVRFKWNPVVGFCTVSTSKQDIVDPDDCRVVSPGQTLPFELDTHDQYVWGELVDESVPSESFGLKNDSGVGKTFALCVVGNGDPEAEDDEEEVSETAFEPVLTFESPLDEQVETSLPAKLQAYAVSKHKKGQLINQKVLANPIFSDPLNKKVGKPVDLTEDATTFTWLLYSTPSGKVTLKRKT